MPNTIETDKPSSIIPKTHFFDSLLENSGG